MRLIHIFFKISKAIRQFVLLFRLFVRVVNLKLFFQFCELKQKQFHVRTKRVNSQTNCLIALEILKKKWLCLVSILIYLAVPKWEN